MHLTFSGIYSVCVCLCMYAHMYKYMLTSMYVCMYVYIRKSPFLLPFMFSATNISIHWANQRCHQQQCNKSYGLDGSSPQWCACAVSFWPFVDHCRVYVRGGGGVKRCTMWGGRCGGQMTSDQKCWRLSHVWVVLCGKKCVCLRDSAYMYGMCFYVCMFTKWKVKSMLMYEVVWEYVGMWNTADC